MSSDGVVPDLSAHNEITRLRAELAEFHEQAAMKEKRLQLIQARWDAQKAQVETQATQHRLEAEKRQERLKAIVEAVETRRAGPIFVPPGPPQLQFVEEHAFHLGATAVILANIVTMFLELTDRSYTTKFFWVDQSFMIFYMVEISLKALLLQRHLLCGKLSTVCWNWLDLIIVVTGVIDMYLKPLLVLCGAFSEDAAGSSVLSFLRLLRLARLARILKIVKQFLQADLSWADGVRFQSFIMGVIGFNALIMGFEADLPDFAGWVYIEHLLLLIFSFELLVRVKLQGCKFFTSLDTLVWNWLDFVIVTGGVVDQWMMPAVSFVQRLMGWQTAKSGSIAQVMMMLRMARLLRILRLVRLVRNIPPLFTLVIGIMQAMGGMAWVLLLTLVVLYTFALLAVRLLGHGLIFGGGEAPTEVAVFPSVPESMFVLFKIMNADFSPMTGLFDVMPIMKFVVVIFMIISTWSILSILTAVVSDSMLSASEDTRDDHEEGANSLTTERSRIKLSEIFMSLGASKSHTLSTEEFEEALRDEATRYELCAAADLPEKSLRSVWTALCVEDEDGNGYVMHEDFVDGLAWESTPVSERSMMHFETRLADLEHVLRTVHNADLAAARRDAGTFELEPQEGGQPTSTSEPEVWRPMHEQTPALRDAQDGLGSQH